MTKEQEPPAARAQQTAFDALDLRAELLAAVCAAGYRETTPIQRAAIPHVLEGRDVLGCAQTGTGKTAAFALPILDELLSTRRAPGPARIRALVLAPTRELAAQIGASFVRYAPAGRVRCQVVFGGVGKQPQVVALRRGADVLVATPGRLLDLMDDGEVRLEHVETFVLDEADRMLDMGFIRDVRRIIQALPRQRQTLLFSATMPDEIQDLARRILRDPVKVMVDPVSSTVEPLEQAVYFVETRSKVALLLELLKDRSIDRALVFTRTKRGANRVAEKLQAACIEVAAIHGNKSQSARERALDRFKRGLTRVVVATDLAARGIDVKDVSHVINFELPNEPEIYVHRVGRTGRAGASGIALSLCAEDERPFLASIERLTQRRIQRLPTPEGLASRPADVADGAGSREAPRGGTRERRAVPAARRASRPAVAASGAAAEKRSGGGRGPRRSRRSGRR